MIINKLDSLKQAKIIISENGDNFRVIPIPDSEIRVSYTDNRISSVTLLYGDASYDIKSFETSSFSDSDTDGSFDSITLTVSGNVDVAGDIDITVESDFFDTVNITVDVDQDEDLSSIATKIETALLDTIVATYYTIDSVSSDVVLIAIDKNKSDGSLNMILELGTAEGLARVNDATVNSAFALPDLWELVGYFIAGGAKHNFKDTVVLEDIENVTPSPFILYYYEQGLYIGDTNELKPIYTSEIAVTPGLSEILDISNVAGTIITGLSTPVSGTDAVTKTYADTLLNSVPLMVGVRISQTGTSDPVKVGSFSSRSDTAFTLSRDSVGSYTLSFTTGNVETNHVLISSLNKAISTLESMVVTFVNATTITIETYNAAGALADDILLNSQILIISKK